MLRVISIYELVGGDRDITFGILENDFYDLYLQYDEKMIVCVDYDDCFVKMEAMKKIIGGIFFVVSGGL